MSVFFSVSLTKPFSSRFLPCLVHVWLSSPWPRLSQAVSFPVWFMRGSIDWRDHVLPGFDMRPGRTLARSPRTVPWEIGFPWATVMIIQTAAAVPVGDDRGRGSACAKAVGVNTSRGVGTSVTAKMPNACVCCGAGKGHDGKPGGARTMRSKPSTPRPNARAVSVPHLRPNQPILLKLRRRVVTQQKCFRRCPCALGLGVMRQP